LTRPCIGRERASSARTRIPILLTKAAALLHSLAGIPLVDGNKRLAWLATYVFCARNGIELDPSDDDAYALVISVAAGELDDVAEVACVLATLLAGRVDGRDRRPAYARGLFSSA
jgi:prophage maintenance system killer protein